MRLRICICNAFAHILAAMQRLARYLKEQGLSQVAFGAKMGVNQGTVSKWLDGINEPSAPMLKRMAAATGLSIDELLDLPGRSKRAGRQALGA
jgi:transcriptional regulator with XRE-family HTH domain